MLGIERSLTAIAVLVVGAGGSAAASTVLPNVALSVVIRTGVAATKTEGRHVVAAPRVVAAVAVQTTTWAVECGLVS